jgi:hypothetical protein
MKKEGRTPVAYQDISPVGYRGAYGYGKFPDDLYRLEDLDDFGITDEEADPRGWALMSNQVDDALGKVRDLIVSPTTEEAYFAVIDRGNLFQRRIYAIPLDMIEVDPVDRIAHAPFTPEQFQKAPELDDRNRDFSLHYQYWQSLAAPVEGEVPIEDSRLRDFAHLRPYEKRRRVTRPEAGAGEARPWEPREDGDLFFEHGFEEEMAYEQEMEDLAPEADRGPTLTSNDNSLADQGEPISRRT